MRGRTNAIKGVPLNASTASKTLRSGQVVSGDFVEYYTDNPTIQQSDVNTFVCNIGDYAVTIKANSLCLFKNKAQIDQYTGHDVQVACQYGDYIIFFGKSNVVGVMSIVSDHFNLVSSISTTIYTSNYSYFQGIAVSNGMVVIYTTNYKENSNEKANFAVLDISNSGILSNLTETNNISAAYFNFIDAYNGNFYAYYNRFSSIVPLTINTDRTVSFGAYANIGIGDVIRFKMAQFDNVVIYATYVSNNNYVVIIDLSGKTGASLQTDGVAVTNIDNGRFVTIRMRNSAFVFNLYSYNTTTKEIALIYEATGIPITIVGYTTTTGFINNGIAYIRQINTSDAIVNNSLRLLQVTSNVIQDIPNVDYVIPYAENGHPIGVAKQSASAPATIDVYIPTASS